MTVADRPNRLYARGMVRHPLPTTQGTLLLILYGLTLVTLAALVAFMTTTTQYLCDQDSARAFLERIQGLPGEGWKVAGLTFGSFAAAVGLTVVRARWPRRTWVQVGFSLVELGLAIVLILVLGFGYRGILFLVFINGLRFLPGRRPKILFLALCLLTFLVADAGTVSLVLPVFSIDTYFNAYPEAARAWLNSSRNLLLTANEILFLVYMGWEVQRWIEETTKIRDLNRQLVKTSQELAVANVRLEDYARRADRAAQHRERRRMAGEIHDILGHSLMGIELGLQACLEILDLDPGRVRKQLGTMVQMARSGVDEVRRKVHQRSVDEGTNRTLIDSLQTLAAGIREGIGRKVELVVEGEPVVLPPVQEEVLYRIAQESMTNAIAHGDAKRIDLELRFNPQSFELSVIDDGSGGGAFQEGFGLRNMRERAESAGGQILFANREQGFLVMVTLPRGPRPGGTP